MKCRPRGAFYDEHEYVNTDAKARSGELFILDESKEKDEHSWKAQILLADSGGEAATDQRGDDPLTT